MNGQIKWLRNSYVPFHSITSLVKTCRKTIHISDEFSVRNKSFFQLNDHRENIMLSFSESKNEVLSAVTAVIIFSELFCRLDLQAAQHL